jgi:hypothetical protein
MALYIFSTEFRMALTDDQIYDLLKDLPDFDRLPLPKYFYEKFNIPPPKILTPMEAIRLMEKTACAPGLVSTPIEIREPAPGGVREMPQGEPVPVEVLPLPIEDAIKAREHKESERRDSQTCSDLSGGQPNTTG